MRIRERLALAFMPKDKRKLYLQSSTPEEFFGSRDDAPVNEYTAVTATAVWSAVRLLAEQVGQLPIHIYRRRPDGTRTKAREHPLYQILHDAPNPMMSAFQWKETEMLWMLLRGRGVSQVQRDSMGRVRRLWPIQSDRVDVDVNTQGNREFRIDGRPVRPSSVLFVPGISWDGYDGISVIQALKNSVGLTIGAEKYGKTYFDTGGDIKGYLKYDDFFREEAARRRVLDGWNSKYGNGAASGNKTPLLERGIEYEKVTPSNDDAQFIETRKFQVTEVARIFRVPPHMIYDLERSTFSNIDTQSREFLQYSLQPWLVRIEQAINQQLLSEEERGTYYVEFDTAALLRPTLKDRYEAYAVARQWGWQSVNDIRRLENDEPIGPAGDRYLEPENMRPAGEDSTDETED